MADFLSRKLPALGTLWPDWEDCVANRWLMVKHVGKDFAIGKYGSDMVRDNYTIRVNNNRLPEPILPQTAGHGIHRLVVLTRVVVVRPDGIDVPRAPVLPSINAFCRNGNYSLTEDSHGLCRRQQFPLTVVWIDVEHNRVSYYCSRAGCFRSTGWAVRGERGRGRTTRR